MTKQLNIDGHETELHDPDGRIVTDVIIISRAVYPGTDKERTKDGFGIMTSDDTTGAVVTGMLIQALRHDEHNSFAEDRKSTRLNSSHVAISYAVFCLYKETQS